MNILSCSIVHDATDWLLIDGRQPANVRF